jgi:hypothetical protein
LPNAKQDVGGAVTRVVVAMIIFVPKGILTRDTSAELTLEVRPTAKDVVSPPVGLLTPDNGAIGELAGLV